MNLRRVRLIGYIRTGDTSMDVESQRELIEHFCAGHNYSLAGFAEVDHGKPSFGLMEATEYLEQGRADGIVAIDLDRFIFNSGDRALNLRTLIKHLLSHNKVLVTICDRVETVTANGQHNLMDLVLKHYRREDATVDTFGWSQPSANVTAEMERTIPPRIVPFSNR